MHFAEYKQFFLRTIKCEKHQILHDPDKVFAYLQQYETKHAQMSLF